MAKKRLLRHHRGNPTQRKQVKNAPRTGLNPADGGNNHDDPLPATKHRSHGHTLLRYLQLTTIALTLLVLIIVAGNVWTHDNIIIFKGINLSKLLSDYGISEDYIKQRMAMETNAALDSVYIKLRQLSMGNIADTHIPGSDSRRRRGRVKTEDEAFGISGDYFSIDLRSVTRSLRATLTSYKDISVTVIFSSDTAGSISAHSVISRGDVESNRFHSVNIADCGDPAKCVDALIAKISADVAGLIDGLAIVLKDLRYDGDIESYDNNVWHDSQLTSEQKLDCLKNSASIPDPPAGAWRHAIIASIYEHRGYANHNIGDLNEAIGHYTLFANEIPGIADGFVQTRIGFISRYINEVRSAENLPGDVRRMLPDKMGQRHPCRQLVVVTASGARRNKALMQRYMLSGGKWTAIGTSIDVNVGAKGIAPVGRKREGDYRTPAGIYSLTRAFGYEADCNTALLYTVVGPLHVWVTDQSDSLYNRIIVDSLHMYRNRSEPLMLISRITRHAIAIDYNTDPVVPGAGSAIFIHCRRTSDHRTAGCISMPESNLLELLEWLDPQLHPHIVIRC